MRTGRIALSDGEFARLRTLLARTAGLVFDETRRDSVAYCVAERIRASGAPDVPAYLELLADGTERQALLDEVTIQETHFFRNPPQIQALRRYVLPELIERARDRGRRIRIWSAGCSTGEEPYTIAMLLRELLPSSTGWDVSILATDVSSRALQVAEKAVYGKRAVQMATPGDLARFFMRTAAGGYAVRPEVRDLVQLRHHNLVADPAPFDSGDGVDLVLCRNVTIYFSRNTTRALMSRLHSVLRDGGYLFLGHSETLWQVSDEFRLVALGTGDSAAFVYRRLDEPAGGRRGSVLPDRRTAADGPPAAVPERRAAARRTRVTSWPTAAGPTAAPPTAAGPTGAPPTSAGPTAAPTAAGPTAASPTSAGPTAAPPVAAPRAPARVDQRAAALETRLALAEGRYEEAAERATELLATAALDPTGYYLRGLARVNAGADERAVADLRRAVYLDPGDGLAHFLLAGVLRRLGDATAAAREFRAAADTLGTRPTDATAPELGGRGARELAGLCERLSRELLEEDA